MEPMTPPKVTTHYQHISWTWHAKHWFWCMMTGLIWLPFYLVKWSNRKRPVGRSVTR